MKINTCNENNLPGLIPRELLFNTPIMNRNHINIPQLSCDGKKLLYLKSTNNISGLCIKTIGEEDEKLIFSGEKATILDYTWSSNDYIIYFQDTGKAEHPAMYRLNIKTGEVKLLIPDKNVRVRYVYHNEYLFSGEIIISMNKDNPALSDLYHLNI